MAGLIKRNSMMKLKDSGYELIIPTGYHLCKCSKLSLCHLLLRYRPFSSLVLHWRTVTPKWLIPFCHLPTAPAFSDLSFHRRSLDMCVAVVPGYPKLTCLCQPSAPPDSQHLDAHLQTVQLWHNLMSVMKGMGRNLHPYKLCHTSMETAVQSPEPGPSARHGCVHL